VRFTNSHHTGTVLRLCGTVQGVMVNIPSWTNMSNVVTRDKRKRKDLRKFEALEGLHTKTVRILVKTYTIKQKLFVSGVPWQFQITKCEVVWNYWQMLFNTRLHSDSFVLWKIGWPVTFSPTFIPLSIPIEPQKKNYKQAKVRRISEVFIPQTCPQNTQFLPKMNFIP
jgi:hypothetical protein